MTNSTQTRKVQEMTSSEECNGWPNRETWAASLHLSNDFGLYTMVNGWANDARQECLEWLDDNPDAPERYGWNVETATVTRLADKLRDYIDTLRADMQEGFDHDAPLPTETERMMVLEIGSEWRVDWREVARNWLEGFEFEGEES